MPKKPSGPCASTILLLTSRLAARSSAASLDRTSRCRSRQVKASAATAAVSAGTLVSPAPARGAVHPPRGAHRPALALGPLTRGVPEPAVVLSRQEPADHLLPHPLAVDTQRQHAQAVLVVTGEGSAVVPGT